jgi:outer membrane immunogenic protein
MKRLILGCIVLAAMMPAVADAADLRVKARPRAVDPVYDWTGFYIGGNLGGVGTVGQRFMPDLPLVGLPPTLFTSPRQWDWIYGVHAGLQRQWGNWVIGLEASYSAGSNQMRNNVSISPPEPFSKLDAVWLTTDLVTVGPRVGYAWDRLMVYGTGGYAGAHIQGRYACSVDGVFILPGPGTCTLAVFGPALTQTNFSGTSWNNGWFVGGGIDFVAYQGTFADILVGGEYRHYELEMRPGFTCTPAICGMFMPHQSFLHSSSGDIARVRLTFKTRGWAFP